MPHPGHFIPVADFIGQYQMSTLNCLATMAIKKKKRIVYNILRFASRKNIKKPTFLA
jgi:hypothetical protein